MHDARSHQVESSAEGTVEPARDAARKRLLAKRDFVTHLITYVVVNGFLVLVWAFTGRGYFWPAWVIGAWGIGLILHARDVFWRRPITEADIDRELRRQERH